MFNRQEYQINWYKLHQKKCSDCYNLIKFNSIRCKSCETNRRWRSGLMDDIIHSINTGSFQKGNIPQFKFPKGNIPWNKGKEHLAGEKHWNWQGGKTLKYWDIRMTTDYKKWRTEVFKRDKWTCVLCGYRSHKKLQGNKSDIEADHIKPLALFRELIFDLANGRTLCRDCHRKTDTYGGRVRSLKWLK